MYASLSCWMYFSSLISIKILENLWKIWFSLMWPRFFSFDIAPVLDRMRLKGDKNKNMESFLEAKFECNRISHLHINYSRSLQDWFEKKLKRIWYSECRLLFKVNINIINFLLRSWVSQSEQPQSKSASTISISKPNQSNQAKEQLMIFQQIWKLEQQTLTSFLNTRCRF